MSVEDELLALARAWEGASGEARRAFLVARYREQGAGGESTIRIMGQVNATDLSPGVQMVWEGRVVQWTPDEAVRHAMNILEVTVAAEGDAFLVQFVTARLGADKARAAQLLQDFRRRARPRAPGSGGGACAARNR